MESGREKTEESQRLIVMRNITGARDGARIGEEVAEPRSVSALPIDGIQFFREKQYNDVMKAFQVLYVVELLYEGRWMRIYEDPTFPTEWGNREEFSASEIRDIIARTTR